MQINELRARLSNVKTAGKGHSARCPAHDDHDNSLSVNLGDDGKILLKCFAGCTVEAICGALGIELKDLFNDPKPPKKKREKKAEPPLTLAQLAAAKQLPMEFLLEQGLGDDPHGGGVLIGYFELDGEQAARTRKRTALRAKEGSWWLGPEGVGVIPYGLWKLAEWRK